MKLRERLFCNTTLSQRRSGGYCVRHLNEVFSNEIAQSVDVCLKRIVHSGGVAELGHRFIPSQIDGRDVLFFRIEYERETEIDIVILGGTFSAGVPLYFALEVVASTAMYGMWDIRE